MNYFRSRLHDIGYPEDFIIASAVETTFVVCSMNGVDIRSADSLTFVHCSGIVRFSARTRNVTVHSAAGEIWFDSIPQDTFLDLVTAQFVR